MEACKRGTQKQKQRVEEQQLGWKERKNNY